MISTVFENKTIYKQETSIRVELSSAQYIEFVEDEAYQMEIYTDSNKGNSIDIENIRVYC